MVEFSGAYATLVSISWDALLAIEGTTRARHQELGDSAVEPIRAPSARRKDRLIERTPRQ